MPKDFRMQRISDLIRISLSELLLHYSDDERFNKVIINKIIVSRDMNHARIYVSCFTDESIEDIVKSLNQHAKDLRYRLAQTVKLRVTPDLKFYFDDTSIKGQRIDELLHKVLKEEK